MYIHDFFQNFLKTFLVCFHGAFTSSVIAPDMPPPPTPSGAVHDEHHRSRDAPARPLPLGSSTKQRPAALPTPSASRFFCGDPARIESAARPAAHRRRRRDRFPPISKARAFDEYFSPRPLVDARDLPGLDPPTSPRSRRRRRAARRGDHHHPLLTGPMG